MFCRSCDSLKINPILHLGQMPLANGLLKHHQLLDNEPMHPLEIVLCETCSLVQLKQTIEPSLLFDEYVYFSSHADSAVLSAQQLVNEITASLPPDAFIVEIASNDGYLLQHYIKKNMAVCGIEPAKNIAQHALQKGIPTRCAYFSKATAQTLVYENKQADIIHANNVMAHVPDINDFIAGIALLLKPNGKAIIEVPYLLHLMDNCEFDTIYHEHVFYFSITALDVLFKRHKLSLNHAEPLSIHGGSLRLSVTHEHRRNPTTALIKQLENEAKRNIKHMKCYEHFSQNIQNLKKTLLTLLYDLKDQGIKIAAYGASAKGSTLLNFYGIGKDIIDFVVDRSPVKQGQYTPGTHLPIYSPEKLIEKNIQYTLLLTWNFMDEILEQQKRYRESGGKFIVPIPSVRVM